MKKIKKKFLLYYCLTAVCFSSIGVNYAQSNRLTNENGELLWQYNQFVTVDEENHNTIRVSFIFINGIKQTAIQLRQELSYSQIEWLKPYDIQAEKEGYVEFLTVNLAPNESVIWKYVINTKSVNKELLLEKSAILIMNEDFEVRKEVIPEQRLPLSVIQHHGHNQH